MNVSTNRNAYGFECISDITLNKLCFYGIAKLFKLYRNKLSNISRPATRRNMDGTDEKDNKESLLR